jgi:hypothetical protein
LLSYGAIKSDVTIEQETQLQHSNSYTTEESWEAVFSVGLCRGYIWRIETQAKKKTIFGREPQGLGANTN